MRQRRDLGIRRREFLFSAIAGANAIVLNAGEALRPIVISVHAMLDRGAHSGKGLRDSEIALFKICQEKARREYAVSGIHFDVRTVEGAYIRQQGFSEIPDKFLARGTINLFVTDTLGYDIDRDRTGGCSVGPHPRRGRFAGDPFYETFLGLSDANEGTLAHEYAHHFTLDTKRKSTWLSNSWADFRNNYWLWLQRRGVPIMAFRACANSEWARFEAAT
ncbi:MAG: hypothetical protein JOZ32_07750 [Bryobacterales bacterium]|nr:hypothetical protein [Bryobacterales bacterium]